MAADWHIVSFPLILPWRDEFWTLPLYFPGLQVGVAPGWPAQMPYQGLPLPPEAQVRRELKGYHPGELRQWQAYESYQEGQSEGGDLLRDIRRYGQVEAPEPDAAPQAWALAWQLEKLQADQEAQLTMVDQGQGWLQDILTPEPWETPSSFGSVPGVQEMVDEDLAKLRYRLWRKVMDPFLQDPWAPLLLGRSSRSLFLTLKGWPQWTNLQKVQVSLPTCRSAEEWRRVCGNGGAPTWQQEMVGLWQDLLGVADDLEKLEAAAGEIAAFVENTVVPAWPFPVIASFEVEVWAVDSDTPGPILCWTGAGAGILPG